MNIHLYIEEAAELGERFPDLCDSDVIHAVADICGFAPQGVYNTAHERVILRAYDGGVTAGRECARTWGVLR